MSPDELKCFKNIRFYKKCTKFLQKVKQFKIEVIICMLFAIYDWF
jgi:hypothetical protein